jgi:hypothetical protein
MRRIWEISSIGVIFLIIISTLIGFVGVGVVTSNERPPIGQAPPVNTTTTTDVISQSQGEDMQAYTVTASNMDAIDAAQLTEYGEIGTRADRRIELKEHLLGNRCSSCYASRTCSSRYSRISSRG